MDNWMQLARDFLKEGNPTEFRRMQQAWTKDPETGEDVTELGLYLERKERDCLEAYRNLVKRLEKRMPDNPGMARKIAEEQIQRDLLDPRA